MSSRAAPVADRAWLAPVGEPADGATRYAMRRTVGPGVDVQPDGPQRAVVDHQGGRLRVLAGPGTGKTATLVEAVVDRIANRGVPASQVLVLTFARRAAGELVARINARLGITVREPIVRTVHAYAYALLRAHALRLGEPPPRLLAAGQSDTMVRELLAGQLAAGGGPWPESYRAALGTPEFAAELRDLLLRTAERGITPARLAGLGRRRHRPEWQAAAGFARLYQDVADLRQGSSGFGAALDQAELTTAALALLRSDPILAAEQSRVRRLFVDEYQDVDPAQARLIERLSSGLDEVVIFGDPDQSIYAFRGADPGALREFDAAPTIALTTSRRMPPGLVRASRRVAARLPGPVAHRRLTTSDPAPIPTAVTAAPDEQEPDVRLFATAAQEASYAADQLRRAHVRDDVPWSRMAVLVRSPEAAMPVLRRAFTTAGVPLRAAGTTTSLTGDPLVRALLSVLRCGARPQLLTGPVAAELLCSPLIGMSDADLRRLRRQLRASADPGVPSLDLVAAALSNPTDRSGIDPGVDEDLAVRVRRAGDMLAAARSGASAPTAEDPLWQVWRRAGLAEALAASAVRGGRAGARADAMLDAVLVLFDFAADLAARLPMGGLPAFLDAVDDQQLAPVGPPSDLGAGHAVDAVAVLSAHAAKGLEWDLVALVGVQEGTWPDLRIRSGLLDVEEALDAAASVPPSASRTAARLADERRLFYVAATRARRRLIATAVQSLDATPSRFLAELAGTDDLSSGWPDDLPSRGRRLHAADLIAALRAAAADPASAPDRVSEAAAQLARLAAAGFPGAHPREWYGLAELSTAAPPVAAGAPVTVSPSAVEALSACGLRAVLERRGGRVDSGQAQVEGIVLHALVSGVAGGVPEAALTAEIDQFLREQDQLPPWQRARTRRALVGMLGAARDWVGEHHPPREMIGSEVQVAATLPDDGDGGRPVRVEGRADWLDQRADGSVVVVDFKTGATVPTRAEAAENAQLASYQLAIDLGAAGAGPEAPAGGANRAGGAELVYLRSGTPKVLTQPPLDDVAVRRWRHVVRAAAEQLASSAVTAREHGRCDRCPLRSSCPLQPDGRQVTR